MKKLMMVTVMVTGVLSLFGETDEIGKAVARTFADKTAVISVTKSSMSPHVEKLLPLPIGRGASWQHLSL